MIAVAVSATNNCDYCLRSHTDALRSMGTTDEELVELLSVVDFFNGSNAIASGLKVDYEPRCRRPTPHRDHRAGADRPRRGPGSGLAAAAAIVTGFGITATRRTMLVHLTDENGVEGWGEGPALDHPYYLPDTTSSAFGVAADFALPLALAAPTLSPADVVEAMARIRGNTFARAGVEEAFWSLQAAVVGSSLSELVGGRPGDIAVGESLSITDTIEETLEEVALRISEGYRRIKLEDPAGVGRRRRGRRAWPRR